jgi:uncharacterized protein
MKTVARISVTPVKGCRLAHPEAIDLTEHGAADDRLFSLVWADGGRVRSSLNAWHNTVEARYENGLLELRFADGATVEGDGDALGEELIIDFGGRRIPVRVVDGPWTEPLGRLAGRPVRLVRGRQANAGKDAAVSLVSDGSLLLFEREAGRSLDPRRFRMLFELAGCDEHEEDGWSGRLVQIGAAVVRVAAPVVRCAVTTRDPATGETDFDTLSLLERYRGRVTFGMHAHVERAGRVRVGDEVALLD